LNYKAISLPQKLGLFTEHWNRKVVAEMNDYQFKIVKLLGDFIWHDHKDTDEAFIVIEVISGSILAMAWFTCSWRDVCCSQGH
jgi:hypothetical protein